MSEDLKFQIERAKALLEDIVALGDALGNEASPLERKKKLVAIAGDAEMLRQRALYLRVEAVRLALEIDAPDPDTDKILSYLVWETH